MQISLLVGAVNNNGLPRQNPTLIDGTQIIPTRPINRSDRSQVNKPLRWNRLQRSSVRSSFSVSVAVSQTCNGNDRNGSRTKNGMPERNGFGFCWVRVGFGLGSGWGLGLVVSHPTTLTAGGAWRLPIRSESES